MAIKLILRKEDLDLIGALDSAVEDGHLEFLSSKQLKSWSSFHERVLAAEMKPKKKGGGLSVSKAVEVLRGVLGRRLVLPVAPGPQWFIPLQNRINASGITEAHIKAAGQVAAAQWKGPIKAESIIRQCDVLVSDANMERLKLEAPPESVDMEDL